MVTVLLGFTGYYFVTEDYVYLFLYLWGILLRYQ